LADAALVVLRFWIAALVRLGEEIASETMRMSAHAVRGEGKFQMVKKKTKMRLPRESQRLRTFSTIACSTILAFMAVVGTTMAQPAPEQKLAPVLNENAKNRIPGQYIVLFKPGTSPETVAAAKATAKKLNGSIKHTYTSALIGFSAKLPTEALQALRAMPDVAYIEADQKVSIQTIQPPTPPGNPPTGIDRIDRRLLPLNNTYTYSETGAGVNVYVIDTGIRVTHNEFGGRASGAVTEITDANGTNDCNGHGTNVAGIIGATTYGVAKGVNLHAVRVLDCSGNGTVSGAIAGVDWVTTNATHPAVANISLAVTGGSSTALDTSVTNSIASGVTYAIAAGNLNVDACTVSPADVPAAITVGNIDPSNDTRLGTSDFGTCVDLFAPGVNSLSTGNASDTATSTYTGTSQASPHVAGVAARYLQNHTSATPAQVWAAIHNADDVATTAGWGGLINSGTGSPNELLHWGSLNDGFNDGDPHLTTVEGIHYDFQSAGEFVSLRDDDGMEIQTRQAVISTTFTPGPDAHDELATCVSLNSAVAARVGDQRVTYQPNLSGVPDPSGLQLRVDGELITLGAGGLDLEAGGRVVKTSVGGIEIDFPNETVLIVTPGWWAAQSKWYLNVDVFHTPAEEGILGIIPPRSWLPALPDGTSMGPMPGPLHERYVVLYQKFADAWRVTDRTTLFDYAPGTSTNTFMRRSWPLEHGPCVIADTEPARPASKEVALMACRPVTDKNANKNCVFDVMATGDIGFAKTYVLSQRMRIGGTRTIVADNENPTQVGEWVTFTSTVAALSGKGHPTGTVQFTLDGAKAGGQVRLDSNGRVTWETPRLKVGTHRVAASYTPSKDSVFLNSTSLEKLHSVRRCSCESESK